MFIVHFLYFYVFLTFVLVKISAAASMYQTSNVSTISSICALKSGDYLLCHGNIDVPPPSFQENITSSFFHSNIRKVRFSNLNLGDFNLSIFDDISDNIRSFAINQCKFTSLSFEVGKTWNSLTNFEFTGNDISFVHTTELPFWSPLTINNAPKLSTLNLTGNGLGRFVNDMAETWFNFVEFKSLKTLDLSNNDINSCPRLPSGLSTLNLQQNSITEVDSEKFSNVSQLEKIDFGNNAIKTISPQTFDSTRLRSLNLSRNMLTTIDDFANLNTLETLDLSDNRITAIRSATIKLSNGLRVLRLKNNPIDRVQPFPPLNLELIDLSQSDVEVVNLNVFHALKRLKVVTMQQSKRLRSIVGKIAENLPSLERINVKNCSMTFFSTDVFRSSKKLRFIDASDNPWPCDCRLSWLTNVPSSMNWENSERTYCFNNNTTTNKTLFIDLKMESLIANDACVVGSMIANGTIVRTKYGESALLDCKTYGDPRPSVSWRRIDSDPIAELHENETSVYILFDDGTLRVKNVYKNDVGLYECTVGNGYANLTAYTCLRLSYAGTWWFIKVASVFCGIITALGFFGLNMIYNAIRRVIVWRMSKLEQTSRVRSLLESLEKYRQRQMEYLHEIYASNMNQVRENYHQQVEQLRKSYTAQADRFRDYRTAQMESVAHHIDSLRDNYAAQMNRMRDYGGRQMERLWESYQSRVNRLRDFSLQQRLRLMRHYKIKQRYLNKLLENLNVESCRRRPNSTVIGPELIELPRIMPDDDLPALVRFDNNEQLLSSSQSSYLDPVFQTSASSRSIYLTEDDFDEEDDNINDDVSSYHSFPDEMLFITDENNDVCDEQPSRFTLEVNFERAVSPNAFRDRQTD